MRLCVFYLVLLFACAIFLDGIARSAEKPKPDQPQFHTSDRCMACHNGMTTASGADVSIGLDWRASIMANSSRDPYWQASVRRETIDHPSARAEVEDECSICHMPIPRYEAKLQGHVGEIFSHLPFSPDKRNNAAAEDGVTCAVCHQVTSDKLGTREGFNGGFVVAPPEPDAARPEYGPFDIQPGQQRIMRTSTGGYRPTPATQIRDAALCGSCHTLYTTALGTDGQKIGTLPEQMPFLEWQHSDYREAITCQGCHMPELDGEVPIAKVLGIDRPGVHRHLFVGGNFFMLGLLNQYRADLSVAALPQELTVSAQRTLDFLQSQAARVTIPFSELTDAKLEIDVLAENLAGHKLPSAFPSRRAWVHLTVREANGQIVFESGGLNPDGSIRGNDNDADPTRYESHYRQITSPDEVEIYESILGDQEGRVTTGLLQAVGYLKDNRLLPRGFDKRTADRDIAVVGGAMDDPSFTDAGDKIHYSVPIAGAQGPFQISVELLYQPIGFRWAHNLQPYAASETQRMVGYYDSLSRSTATVLSHAETKR
jgi:hypothetical protein